MVIVTTLLWWLWLHYYGDCHYITMVIVTTLLWWLWLHYYDDNDNDNDNILFDHNIQIEKIMYNSLENQIINWSGDYY